MKLPTVKEVERGIGLTTDQWEGQCYKVSCLLLLRGLVSGELVCGHFLGKVGAESRFSDGELDDNDAYTHGWIRLPDGRILDPTRWVFEGTKPYLYTGPEGEEYDEDGSKWEAELEEIRRAWEESRRKLEAEFSEMRERMELEKR